MALFVLFLSVMIYHPPKMEYTFYLVMSYFVTGSNGWMQVFASYPLIRAEHFYSSLFIKWLHCIQCSKNSICRCSSVETLVVCLTLTSWFWEFHLPCPFHLCLVHCSSSPNFQGWVACSLILWTTSYDSSNSFKLFFANHKLFGYGLGHNLPSHNFPHL